MRWWCHYLNPSVITTTLVRTSGRLALRASSASCSAAPVAVIPDRNGSAEREQRLDWEWTTALKRIVDSPLIDLTRRSGSLMDPSGILSLFLSGLLYRTTPTRSWVSEMVRPSSTWIRRIHRFTHWKTSGDGKHRDDIMLFQNRDVYIGWWR